MSRHRMDDGSIVDTERAVESWKEERDWDGNNHIGKSSGTQWDYQVLHKSRKGRYYIEFTSNWQGRRDHVEWQSPEDAARWLLHNDIELPEDLKHLEEEISE